MKILTLLGVMAILCLSVNTVFAQVYNTITGTVRNTAGEPLANATVTVVKTGKGAITNARGIFTLTRLNPKDQLRISLIGYNAQTITISNQTNIAVTLKEADNELDRVVVQGYGITSDRMRTGNIGKLTAKEIEKQPVLNVLDALQGRIPGVVVSHNNGYASGTIKVEIRGRNTIDPNQTSEPLYIVDGVPLTVLGLYGENYNTGGNGNIQSGILSPAIGQSILLSINPNDIESLEVLKDADATAIYGSRGANGVVLITTKAGKPGKINFEGNFSSGISSVIRYNQLLTTPEYVAMRREALLNDGLPINAQNAPDLVVWDSTRYTDWQKYLWGNTGQFTNTGATVSGGTALGSFRISGNYSSRSEITTVSGHNRVGGLSFNLRQRTNNNRLNIFLNGRFSTTSISLMGAPTAITTPPNAPAVWDANGNLNYAGWEPLSSRFIFDYLLLSYKSNSDYLNSSLNITYELLKGLTFKTALGFNASNIRQDRKVPAASLNPSTHPLGTAQTGFTSVRNFITEPQLNYLVLTKHGRLDVMAGGSWQVNNTKGAGLMGYQIPNDALLNNLASAKLQTISNSEMSYKYLAAFGRINYQLKDRYIINLNARRDGSSKFGPGRQFGNFASVGGAWIFSEARAVQKLLPFLDFGKIRASYGTAGNDKIQEFQYQSAWYFESNIYNGSPTLLPQRHYDSTIQWQVNKKLETALNLSFLNQLLTLEIAWYKNQCNNQLSTIPVPAYSGFGEVLTNWAANVQNTGWEFTLKGRLLKSKKVTLESQFAISLNRNKLLDYPDFENSPYRNTYVIGKSLNVMKLLHNTGVDPQLGTYTFEDRNGNGTIEINNIEDDRYFLDLAPKYEGSWSNTLNYKNWSLDFFFFFKKQTGIKTTVGNPGNMMNYTVDVLRRWQKPGDITDIARFSTKTAESDIFYLNSDGIYTDASFVRLQNVQLAYRLSPTLLKKLGFKNLSMYVRGQNIAVFSNYKGADPEIQSSRVLPMPRILTGGISVQF